VPNFRVGLLEADYDSEIVTALDVVDYYATYGHAANIKIFYLNANEDSQNPYDLQVCTIFLTPHLFHSCVPSAFLTQSPTRSRFLSEVIATWQ
jgi:hypothetical protein